MKIPLDNDLRVPCLLSERSETASMFAQPPIMPTASVGMAPVFILNRELE
jgi:hypothetical protein